MRWVGGCVGGAAICIILGCIDIFICCGGLDGVGAMLWFRGFVVLCGVFRVLNRRVPTRALNRRVPTRITLGRPWPGLAWPGVLLLHCRVGGGVVVIVASARTFRSWYQAVPGIFC